MNEVDSHPSRVRGLKQAELAAYTDTVFAPITGAWIETRSTAARFLGFIFAPITGAWIETSMLQWKPSVLSASHPSRVRGLKLPVPDREGFFLASHPSRVRGLKPVLFVTQPMTYVSHPSRVRGLKLRKETKASNSKFAPITGAWIETLLESYDPNLINSHPSRVRGLKLY